MYKTPLYDTHVALGGRMVEFAGWGLPVQYPTGPTVEHQAVRTAAGLFDIDHMGQFELRGPDADAFLRRHQHSQAAADCLVVSRRFTRQRRQTLDFSLQRRLAARRLKGIRPARRRFIRI